METIKPVFGPKLLRVSHITYSTNTRIAGRRIIPLGVLADIRVDNIRGLSLVARVKISDDEASSVGQLARKMFSSPFQMLKSEFDRVWRATNPIYEFERLSILHDTALTFSNFKEVKLDIPLQLVKHREETNALKTWVEDEVSATTIREFWALVNEHWTSHVEERALLNKIKEAA